MTNQAVVDVHIHPIGHGEISVSRFVAESVAALKTNYPQLQFQVNPMSTTIVGELDIILHAVQSMHEAQFSAGAIRVSTSIRIDDRRDGKQIDLSERVSKANA